MYFFPIIRKETIVNENIINTRGITNELNNISKTLKVISSDQSQVNKELKRIGISLAQLSDYFKPKEVRESEQYYSDNIGRVFDDLSKVCNARAIGWLQSTFYCKDKYDSDKKIYDIEFLKELLAHLQKTGRFTKLGMFPEKKEFYFLSKYGPAVKYCDETKKFNILTTEEAFLIRPVIEFEKYR